jgi:hypothetical protein
MITKNFRLNALANHLYNNITAINGGNYFMVDGQASKSVELVAASMARASLLMVTRSKRSKRHTLKSRDHHACQCWPD